MTWADIVQFTIIFSIFGELCGIVLYITEKLYPTEDKDAKSLFVCLFYFPVEVGLAAFVVGMLAWGVTGLYKVAL